MVRKMTRYAQRSGELLKRARLREGLTQQELADKLGLKSAASIAQWESGQQTIPDRHRLRLKKILGDPSETEFEGTEISAFGAWLRKTRTGKDISVPELASKSGVSAPAIYNIKSGKSLNPQKETRRRLEKAVGAPIPSDVAKEAEVAQEIQGLGSLTDFDPYDERNLPSVAGVYVFYDVSERPIYVGKAATISARVKEHKDKFWFKPPIVVHERTFLSLMKKSVTKSSKCSSNFLNPMR